LLKAYPLTRIKIRAERKAGELLIEQIDHKEANLFMMNRLAGGGKIDTFVLLINLDTISRRHLKMAK